MIYKITFIEVDDPVQAEASDKPTYQYRTSHELPVSGVPNGGLDRFTKDFYRYIERQFPDMITLEILRVYHIKMSSEELSRRTNLIDKWCVGWAGYDEQIKTP